MKLVMVVEKDSVHLQTGGPLANKYWNINSEIVVIARSGFEEGPHYRDEPRVDVRAQKDWMHPADFSKPFDIVAFEAALNEAREEVIRMRRFIDEAYRALVQAAWEHELSRQH